MNVLSVRRRIARKVAASVDYVERVGQETIAAAARVLQPTGVLVPIKVVVDRQKRAGPRD
jgi:hypothetical protein